MTLSSQWVPEISHHCPRTPFLLVGTQVDLRDDGNMLEKLAKNKQRALNAEMGEKLARELRAVKYVECSALKQVGCWQTLSTLVEMAFPQQKAQNKWWAGPMGQFSFCAECIDLVFSLRGA